MQNSWSDDSEVKTGGVDRIILIFWVYSHVPFSLFCLFARVSVTVHFLSKLRHSEDIAWVDKSSKVIFTWFLKAADTMGWPVVEGEESTRQSIVSISHG